MSGIEFGVFDHIEHLPGVPLERLYRERLELIEYFDAAGYFGYHLAEHHTPANHTMAPSQNVFLSAVSQRTRQLRLIPTVYVLPLHHPLRLIEEICMLDTLSGGRLEIAVGPGGVMEAYFWGQEGDPKINRVRYAETLAILRQGLTHDELSYSGQYYSFDRVPMRLRPFQRPCPPFWYMRNAVSSAQAGFNCLLEGSLDHVEANVRRFRRLWAEAHGAGAPTEQGREPLIGANFFIVVADTDEQAVELGRAAWARFCWNLIVPRRQEAERRGLKQFLGEGSTYARDHVAGGAGRISILPEASVRHHIAAEEMAAIEAAANRLSLTEREARQRRRLPGGIDPNIISGPNVIAGSPSTIRAFLDEFAQTGANYLSCAFQFGSLTHDQARRSVELFTTQVMPRYRHEPALTAR